MSVLYTCFIALYVVPCLMSLAFALDPPGGDTVTKLRNDLQTMNATLENLIVKYTSVQQELASLKGSNNRVAGTAVGFTASVRSRIKYNMGQTIIFDDVLKSYGNGYHGNSGIFTCFRSGLYIFHLSMQSTSYTTAAWIVINGTEFVFVYPGNYGGNTSGGVTAVVKLSVGDRVWVKAHGNDVYCNSNSYFSGALVYDTI